jgi:hypothetical protein
MEQTSTSDLALRDCWPWQHRWTKWKTIEQGSLALADVTVGAYEKQRRECVDCGMCELRKVATT